ncbi:hypothetical protein [Streptomyces sp. NPDC056401]|uniref:hypothetical protein n=1 Tax=Streptomyces sp. NPDC056401 TaxID=3345809 RepID=UPI0035E23F9F
MSEQTSIGAAPQAPDAEAVQDAVPQQGTAPAEGAEAAAPPVDGPPADSAPGDPFAAPAEPVPAGPKDRRKLFAALRWTAAVLVFAAVGTGVAYGITQPERTDIPGLSTQSDGRLVYPPLAYPTLPAGAPLPGAADNPLGTHYASLGSLLLPAPGTAVPEAGFKADKDGLLPLDAFLEEYLAEDRARLKETLEHEGLRQVAGRAWTTPDGTRTHLYLLRFHAPGFVDAFQGCTINTRLVGAVAIGADEEWRSVKGTQKNELAGAANDGTPDWRSAADVSLYREAKPAGDEESRLGCVQSGDIQAVIIQTRKGEVPTIPLHQAVVLQYQLLR